MSQEKLLNRNNSTLGGKQLPTISSNKGPELILDDFRKTNSRLSSALKVKAQTTRNHYQPPNITAFKMDNLGEQGSLLNIKNEQLRAKLEAEMVETRVRKL